jgi:hypothetical protein
MKSRLPATGMVKLLEVLSPHIPDDFINTVLPQLRGRGRRRSFSASQLWRVHLLAPLTSTHSFNALIQRLPDQRAWRRFALLSHRHHVPDVRMLHEFRSAFGVSGFRSVNDVLVMSLLKHLDANRKALAVIDSTDLPASTSDKKKIGATGRPCGPTWEPGPSSRGKPGFSWGIKNIRCACGLAHTGHPLF